MGNYCITTQLVDEDTEKTRTIQQISAMGSQAITHKYQLLNPPIEKNYFYELRRAKDKMTGIVRGVLIFEKLHMNASRYKSYLAQLHSQTQLSHPNIVKIFEVQEDEQRLYVVQEHCSGSRINDRFIVQKRQEEYIANIVQQILGSLQYCHINKIIHGDINFNNFRFENNDLDSLIKIQNFGTNQYTKKNQIMQMDYKKLQWMSPQSLEGKVNYKSDIWQIGIMMLNLLTDQFPFTGIDSKALVHNIKNKPIDFDRLNTKLSKQAQHLIKGLLNKSEGARLSYEQALKHPWITMHCKGKGVKLNLNNLQTGQRKQEFTKFQEITWNIIVKFFTSSKEMQKISHMFLSIDKDKDGYLSYQELVQGFAEYSTQEQAEIQAQNLLDQFDVKQTGNLNFNDFVKASVDKEKMLTEENIRIYFNLIDSDGSGSISQEELKDQFGINDNNFDPVLWQSIIKDIQFDQNNDVTLQEFTKLMMSLVNRRNAIEDEEQEDKTQEHKQQQQGVEQQDNIIEQLTVNDYTNEDKAKIEQMVPPNENTQEQKEDQIQNRQSIELSHQEQKDMEQIMSARQSIYQQQEENQEKGKENKENNEVAKEKVFE